MTEETEEKKQEWKDWNNNDTLTYEKVDNFPSKSNKNTTIHHAFFTRNGGLSKDVLSSLNVVYSKEDDKSIPTKNRQRLSQVMTNIANERDNPCKFTKFDKDSAFPLITVIEAHTNNVLNITSDMIKSEYNTETMKAIKIEEQYDGMVTNLKNVILGIYTADCCPIFFYDPIQNVIGACHAGWKGALNGIIENTITAMVEQYKVNIDNIECVIGPCIHQKSYQVDKDFINKFVTEWKDVGEKCCVKSEEDKDKLLFDLVEYVKHRLIDNSKIKKENVNVCDIDVFEDERFYSHRRFKKKEEPKFGNFMSCVVMV